MNTAYLIAGLAFGDEGKGATVDFLCRKRQADLVVRYNGGAQAAHNVVTPDGRHHTFSQFGSGTFIPGVRTHLSRFMMVNPLNMMREEEHLREVGITDAWSRLTVEDKALIITPYHKAVNRIQEMYRGDLRHGSCGQGIGITRQLHTDHGDKVLFAGDLDDEFLTYQKLRFIRSKCWDMVKHLEKDLSFALRAEFETFTGLEAWIDYLWDMYAKWPVKTVGQDHLAKLLETSKVSVFEGAQGVLLDEKHGQSPYNTWTDTTFNNAATLLKECAFDGDAVKVGVLRTYFTRHGAGPLPTEGLHLSRHREAHNDTGVYQGAFRLGTFDYNLARKSLAIIGGVDFIALNHIDVLYRSDHRQRELESELQTQVGIRSYGPTADDRQLDI